MELTILMPCLNEAETLAICIQKAKAFLTKESILGEILIADNGSQDGSQHIAELHGARVVHVKERGYGAALQCGIQNALGQYIIMGDADDSYDFLNLMPFVKKLREGSDLVMGNRFKGKIEQGAMPLLNKYIGNPILSFLGRLFFRSQVGDFHCGLRGFKRSAIQQLHLHSQGMEFASEMIAKASLKQLKVTEVPTILAPDGRSRPPHLRPWRDGWRHLRLLLLLSPRWLFLYPGFVLTLLGIGVMGLLISGPFKISQYYLDIHTMLFASMFIIIGLQTIFFFLFARIITHREISGVSIFTLEKGLVIGILLTLLGLLGSSYSFYVWMQHDFGNLLPTKMMRILIPSFTCFISGVQIIFSSFFVSLLKMNRGSEPSSFSSHPLVCETSLQD
jgi:glycosyltransferase involved in cell wall biosynthesis